MPREITAYCASCGRDLPLATQFQPGCSICIHCASLSQEQVSQLTRDTVSREHGALAHLHGEKKASRVRHAMAKYATNGKRCAACHGHKNTSAFDACAPRSDGLQAECRACRLLYTALRAQPGGKALWQTVRNQMRAKSALASVVPAETPSS